MPDKSKCPHLLAELSHCNIHDAIYCEPCDVWVEPKCGKAFCSLCETRPDKPSEVKVSDDDNVVTLDVRTTQPIPVERVIDGLVEDKDKFKSILVLSFDEDGELDSRSSHSNVGELLEMMEQFKHNLFAGRYGRD